MRLSLLAGSLAAAAASPSVKPPNQLLLEYLPSPVLGVDVARPRFSWSVESSVRNTTTAAYQLVVSNAATGAPVWDTGEVARPPGGVWANATVEYAGAPLDADTTYTWRVRWWTATPGGVAADPTPSEYSEPAVFHVGLLDPADWGGAVSIHAAAAPGPLPPPPPPPHATCSSKCKMLEVPGHAYYTGSYNETQTHNVSSIPECQAACLADAACVQITWAPTHSDKCVMYQRLTAAMAGGADGWVKCDAQDTTVEQCTGITPTPPAPAGSPAHLVRHEFAAPPSVRAAFLYLSAVGWAESWVNGQLVDPTLVLNPGRTSFDKRQYTVCHNVTGLVVPGAANVVGVQAAAGWQSMGGHQLSVRAVLTIVDGAGKRTTVPTTPGDGWTGVQGGPAQQSNIYGGEVYDARREVPGWSAAGFDPSPAWPAAVPVTEFAAVTPSWQPMNPIRQLERNPSQSVTQIVLGAGSSDPGATVHVFKFSQNAAGVTSLSLKNCPPGTTLTVFPSEVLCGVGPTRWSPPCAPGQPPGNGQLGTVDQRNYHVNERSQYTCKGGASEEWTPRWTYTGYRYAELHGHNWTAPTPDTVTQVVVHSDVEGAPLPLDLQVTPRTLSGSIMLGGPPDQGAPSINGPACYEGEGCDAPRPAGAAANTAVLDQIAHNVRWVLIDNLHSVPEDCDQRNERWGWTADASVSAEGNFQYHWMPALYASWLREMRDVQTEPGQGCAKAVGPEGDSNVGANGLPNCSGAIADRIPGGTPNALPGDPSWMFAYPLMYSYQMRYVGDRRLSAELWPGIRQYVEFLRGMASRSTTGLVSWAKYGDWLEPGKVPSNPTIAAMSSSFNFGQALRIARDAAAWLGDAEASATYGGAYAAAQKAFHAAYYKGGTYGDGTQPALVYALYLGAVPADLDAAVFAQLLSLIRKGTAECDSAPCLDTGILATKWLMELLSIRGRTDVGLDLAFKTDFPSWGYMARENATTIWEHWEWMAGPGMNSHAHPALGSVGAWLFRWLVGLRLDDGTLETPSDGFGMGWRRVLFAPGCVTDPRLPSAAARVSTLHGPISASWANASGSVKMSIDVPPDVTARVVVPRGVGGGAGTVRVTEGDGSVWWASGRPGPGAHNGRVRAAPSPQGGTAVEILVGSGSWSFVAQ